METRDAIWKQAFCELMISCQHPGCSQIFEPSLAEAATDPVEDWADSMTRRARGKGWKVGKTGAVECEGHGC